MTAMMLAETVVAHYRELVDFLSRRTGSVSYTHLTLPTSDLV